MKMQQWMVLALVPLVLPSCAARYKKLLLAKDAEIRDLELENADLRAANEDLRRNRSFTPPKTVEASSSGDSQIERLRERLPDLDVRVRDGRVAIGVPNTVTFDSGSAKLKPSAGATLRNVARELQAEFATKRVFVEGHTDTDPIRRTKGRFDSNLDLSLERAKAVAEYLMDKCGISEAQVAVAGYGPHDPVDPGRGDRAKARNRRVEIVVSDRL